MPFVDGVMIREARREFFFGVIKNLIDNVTIFVSSTTEKTVMIVRSLGVHRSHTSGFPNFLSLEMIFVGLLEVLLDQRHVVPTIVGQVDDGCLGSSFIRRDDS